MNKITILGSGTSTGVPILGCKCQVCQSNDSRNKRLRTSALIETSTGHKILIDASPDLRAQLLALKIDALDAIVITHDHADHTHGMDDIRPFCLNVQRSLPVFTHEEAAQVLKQKFRYIFAREELYADRPIIGGGIPLLDLHLVGSGEHEICGEKFQFNLLPHGHTSTLSVTHSKMAYIVDCQSIPESTLSSLQSSQLDVLIIDCLRERPHDTHLHLDLSLEYIKKIAPKKAVLTHMGHDCDYVDFMNQLKKRSASNVFPAIDGLSFLYS